MEDSFFSQRNMNDVFLKIARSVIFLKMIKFYQKDTGDQ